MTVVAVNFFWALISMIAIAAQCAPPRPWAIISDKCFNQVSFPILSEPRRIGKKKAG